jgi:glycosyltransferase involved in cell wall biosynthesis
MPLKIAMIGTRGVPANYGGFETCVEEIGKRLVVRGHKVTVYCRDGSYPMKIKEFLGMELVYLPHLKIKAFDTLSHTLLSILHTIGRHYDVLMVFNSANSPILLLPKLLGKKVAINTDGLEWKRGKWGPVGRSYYKFSEWLATKLANCIVADSRGIQDYYKGTYKTDSTYIAYGAYPQESVNPEILKKFGVNPNEYFLQVTRFEPENNPLLTIQAFKKLDTDKKLLLVGGNPYKSEYLNNIKGEANENIILTGPIYEKELLNEIWCNSFAYIHGNEVGGTNPALLQAMANGCFVMAIDVSFSRDVLKDCGIFFNNNIDSLASQMQWTLDNQSSLSFFKKLSSVRITENYCWEKVTDKYESMFLELNNI